MGPVRPVARSSTDPDPGDELVGAEGLGEVVVRAGLQALDRGLLARPRGQHDHRDVPRGRVRPQRAQQFEAVDPRHHHVGQDDVGLPLGHRPERLLAVGRGAHRPVGTEQPCQVAAHVGVVVHDEDVRAQRVARRRLAGPAGVVLPAGRLAPGRLGRLCCGTRLARGQVGGAVGQRHGERAAHAGLADHGDGPAVQGGQLLDQRQPDAGALAGAGGGPGDPVEALEQVRQLVGDDADAGVADGEPEAGLVGGQGHVDAADEGVLHRVGEQVDDDLLPHARVDVGRPGHRRAVHGEPQPRPLGGGAEDPGELGGEGRDVGLHAHRVRPSRLDAGEVEQVVDQALQTPAVAQGQLQLLAGGVGHGLGGVRQDVADRAEEQRQRRPQLVADVGEERRLRPVELGERLRPQALGLEGADVHHDAGELRRDQLVEGAVLGVRGQVGAAPGEQQAQRLAVPGGGEREHHAVGDPVAEGAAGDLERRHEPVQVRGATDHLGETCRVAARRRHPAEAGLTGHGQVDRGEGQVEGVAGQCAAHRGHGRVLVAELAADHRQVVEQPLPALAEDLPGHLGAHRVHAGDLAVVPEGRCVRDGEVGLLAVPRPLEEQQQAGQPRRLEGGHRVLDGRAERVPALGQGVADVLADRRVLGADEGRVGVVVELRELRAPGEHHRELGDEHRADGVAQAGRPVRDRPHGRARPVVRRHQPTGLTARCEQVATGTRRGIGEHAHLPSACYRRSTTWSMQAVSADTSSGSTAGNMPTRSWLRPSLR